MLASRPTLGGRRDKKRGAAMDISPYLRKPLRSLQEVEETRRPRDGAESSTSDAAESSAKAAANEESAIRD